MMEDLPLPRSSATQHSNNLIEESIEEGHNPWSSGDISEFLFYNCPECDVKEKDADTFLEHALQNHNRARFSFIEKNGENLLTDQVDFIEEKSDFIEEKSVLIEEKLDLNCDQEPKDEHVDIDNKQETLSDQDQIDFENQIHNIEFTSEENHVGMKRAYENVIIKEFDDQQVAKKQRSDIKSQCYFCGSVLFGEDANDLQNSMIAHISENHNNKVTPKMYGEIRVYQCKDCLLMFPNKYQTQTHKCGVVPTSWLVVDKKSAKFSVTKKKCTKNQCYYCGEMLSESEQEVRNHIMENHSSFVSAKMYGDRRIYQCSDCNRVFKSPENLELHVCGILPQSWLGPDQKSQKCPKCDQKFTKYGELLCHFNFDHKEETKDQNYPCLHPKCKVPFSDQRITFKSRFELSLHAGTHRHLCNYCGKEYFAPYALSKHNLKCFGKDVREDNPLECLYCSKVFPDLEVLDKHKNKAHQFSMGYYEPACKQMSCKFRASSKKELYEHCKTEHRLICFQCHEVFINRSELHQHHYKKHNNEKNILCDSCDFTCGLLIELDDHKKTVHDKIFAHVCNICGKGFKKLSNLSVHMESIHIKAKTIMCDMCDYRCSFMPQLTIHKKRVHDKVINHTCDTCGKGYFSKSDLNSHERNVHSEGHFGCNYCKSKIVFKTYDALQQHKREKHQKFFICTKCDKVFIGMNALKDHIANEHASFSAYSTFYIRLCMECDARFETTSELNSHLSEDHLLEQDHNCTQCNDAFVTKTILTSHLMEVHSFDPTKEDGMSLPNIERKKVESDNAKVGKNFQCGVCGAYLKSKRTLSDHTKQKHQKETHKFFCTHCNWSTFESTRLKMHIQHLHSQSIFECDKCDYKDKSFLRLRKHISLKHGKPKESMVLTCPQCLEKFTSKNARVQLTKHCLNQHQLLVEVGNLMNSI